MAAVVPRYRNNITPYARPMAGAGLLGLAYHGARAGYNAYPYIKGTLNKFGKYFSTPRPTNMKGRVGSGKVRLVRKRKGIKKQVRELKRKVESDTGTYIYRHRQTERALAGVNQSAHVSLQGVFTTFYEGAIDNLPYFNPAVPGTYTFADLTSGTQQKEVLLENIYYSAECVNNYQSRVKVSLYICVPKADTSISALTAWTSGIADVGGLATTSAQVYLTDSELFNDLWSIKKTVTRTLNPGQKITASYSAKDVQYDPSMTDAHTTTFIKQIKSMQCIVRVEGTIGHDTSADEQGILQSGVDCVIDRKLVIKYPAGIDLKYIELVDQSNTFTNGGVQASMPVADNIGYSVS